MAEDSRDGGSDVDATHQRDGGGDAPPPVHADPQRERRRADEGELHDPHEQRPVQVMADELHVGEREHGDGEQDGPETDPRPGHQQLMIGIADGRPGVPRGR